MQIIIPMSGFGERFRKAGYEVPKPLIVVEGKPIVAHVIDMFPGEHDFIFICNQDHLDHPEFKMESILKNYCPSGRIVGIPSHKLGPIFAVQQVKEFIKLDEPTIVNYCDFTCYWDWSDFKKFVAETKCDGAIPAYKDFHPHTLGSTNYAYMKESGGWVQDIQEKQPYTTNRMQEYASSGTYYFATGRLMLEAFQDTVDKNLNLAGEFYVSLAYKYLLANSKSIAVYPIQHFMQWGTPQDVTEYNFWSKTFKQLIDLKNDDKPSKSSVVIPMAGLGQRFVNEGYKETKPLISVSGKPMVHQATNDLPKSENYIFILRKNMDGYEKISQELMLLYPNCIIEYVDGVTEGQACTALLGILELEKKRGLDHGPVTFGACDNGVLYDHQKYQELIGNPDVDVIVWGARGHTNAIRNPQMYGWINETEKIINSISVKTPLSHPESDPIVLGTFTFRHSADFKKCVDRLIARNGRVNGEFYIDSCINDAIELGLKCYFFEVDSFISWGTPNDLRTFEYWQSCFHKWDSHPYRLELDHRFGKDNLDDFNQRYIQTKPARPDEGL
jgi:NDP-sugar pyrophosphorylase family protein